MKKKETNYTPRRRHFLYKKNKKENEKKKRQADFIDIFRMQEAMTRWCFSTSRLSLALFQCKKFDRTNDLWPNFIFTESIRVAF